MSTFHGIDPAHLSAVSLDSGEHGGRVVLSSVPDRSSHAPAQAFANGLTRFAVNDIRVQAGHLLVLSSGERAPVEVLAQSVTLERGARLIVEGDAMLSAETIRGDAGGTPNVVVQGTDGAPGLPGVAGANGAPGMSGGNGGAGASGGSGNAPRQLALNVETIQGEFVVAYQGGNGGVGGNAGAGGNGGAGGSDTAAGGGGGSGGRGGNGGDGASPGPSIVILYKTIAPGATVTLQNNGGLGGPGGAGGRGGTGGAGSPPGPNGSNGPAGASGRAGPPASLTMQQEVGRAP